jgi:hypothetical protein
VPGIHDKIVYSPLPIQPAAFSAAILMAALAVARMTLTQEEQPQGRSLSKINRSGEAR